MRDGGEDRVAQLVDSLALGDVLGCPEHPRGGAVLVDDHLPAAVDPADRPVGKLHPVVEVKRLPFRERLLDGRLRELTVVWMDGVEVPLVGELSGLRIEPPESIELFRPGDAIRGNVPFPTADLSDFLGLGQAAMSSRELALGSASLVQDCAEDQEADGDACRERLEDLDDFGRRSVAERRHPVDSPRDRRSGEDEAARDRAELVEAQNRPDQQRKEDVGIAPLAAQEHHRPEGDEQAEEGEPLELHSVIEAAPGSRREHEDQWSDDQVAHSVADPPEEPFGVQLRTDDLA